MSTDTRKLRVLVVAPSLDILGGQSRQAVRLMEGLKREPELEVSFLPHNPRLPGILRSLQRIKYVRTIVTTWYYIALLDSRDSRHVEARDYLKRRRVRTVTTDWVLTEVAAGLSPPRTRPLFVQLIGTLRSDPETEIVPFDRDLHEQGLDLYRRRSDKGWSLVDCVSFTVMASRVLTEALTDDHHYEQAGYVPLFAR